MLTSPVWRLLLSQRLMVERETPKRSWTSFLGIPRSTAQSTFNLRSFEYAFMATFSCRSTTYASRCKDDEVLIKVRAVSVNRSDWEGLRGKPLYARIGGLLRPRRQILGSDIAGRVEMAGRNVRQFQPGDEVFGDIMPRLGGFAEYVCAREGALALKPASMTFEEAAAIP